MQIDFEWFNVCVFFHINRRKCAAYVNSKTGHAQHKRCSLNQINQHIQHIHTRTFLQGTLTHVPEDLLIDDDLFPKNEREKKKKKYIYWLRGILRFDAIRLPNSFKIPFNPFVWLCKHSVKLNSTKPNETKRNEIQEERAALIRAGLLTAQEREERGRGKKTNMRNPFLC